MTDWQGVGAALFVSALVGGPGYAATWMFYPGLAATFMFFYTVLAFGLCLIAAGDGE